MEEIFIRRMMEAARFHDRDPGWGAHITTAGLAITYTWQAVAFHPFTGKPKRGKFYTVENLTPWTVIAHAKENPLLLAMDDLLKQKAEFKP